MIRVAFTPDRPPNAAGQRAGADADASETAGARPLGVLHLVSSLQVGGMEQFIVRMAAAQRAGGVEAGIVALRAGPLADQAAQMQILVRALRGGRIGRLAAWVRLVRQMRPDVIHVHNATSLHYGALGKRLSGAPLVLTCHGRSRTDVRAPSGREWRTVDAVVAVSRTTADQVTRPEMARKLSVIHNGVELQPASASREDVRRSLHVGEEPVGIIVARIDGMKGHSTLLDAWAALKRRGVRTSLLVAGDGKARPEIEERARGLGLDARDVRFLGFRTDIPDLLAASDFFLLPSVTEGLPLSMLEAMAHGCPPIATRVGGIPEVVEDGVHGLLVPVGDSEALGAAIERVATSAALRHGLGRAARQRVEVDFTFDGMLRRYDELYRSVLSV